MKKTILKNHKYISRWVSLLSIASIVCIKMIELTSDKIYLMILETPELVEYTSIANSVYFFFV